MPDVDEAGPSSLLEAKEADKALAGLKGLDAAKAQRMIKAHKRAEAWVAGKVSESMKMYAAVEALQEEYSEKMMKVLPDADQDTPEAQLHAKKAEPQLKVLEDEMMGRMAALIGGVEPSPGAPMSLVEVLKLAKAKEEKDRAELHSLLQDEDLDRGMKSMLGVVGLGTEIGTSLIEDVEKDAQNGTELTGEKAGEIMGKIMGFAGKLGTAMGPSIAGPSSFLEEHDDSDLHPKKKSLMETDDSDLTPKQKKLMREVASKLADRDMARMDAAAKNYKDFEHYEEKMKDKLDATHEKEYEKEVIDDSDFWPTAPPSSFVEEGAPDSFADLDAKLKAMEEKTKAELAKLQSDTAAPSSFVEEGAPRRKRLKDEQVMDKADKEVAEIEKKLAAEEKSGEAEEEEVDADLKTVTSYKHPLNDAEEKKENEFMDKLAKKEDAEMKKLPPTFLDQSKFNLDFPTSFLEYGNADARALDDFADVNKDIHDLEKKTAEAVKKADSFGVDHPLQLKSQVDLLRQKSEKSEPASDE